MFKFPLYSFDLPTKFEPLLINLQRTVIKNGKLHKNSEYSLASNFAKTFIVLEVSQNNMVSYKLFDSKLNTLNEIELKEETGDEEVDPVMRYLVIGILILCILGFLFFIINWIRCFLSRPRSHEDEENSSDSEDDERNKGKKMELKNVLDNK